MKPLKKMAVLLAGLLAGAACAPLAADTTGSSASADEAAIRAAGESWDKAYGVLNTDALVALYAPDATFMPEATQTAKGDAEIRRFLVLYVALLADGGYTPAVASAVEIEVSGNLGFRSGTYSVRDKAGTIVDTGKWLETWRKVDGKWLISRDIWNSDMLPLFPPMAFPPAGAPPATSR